MAEKQRRFLLDPLPISIFARVILLMLEVTYLDQTLVQIQTRLTLTTMKNSLTSRIKNRIIDIIDCLLIVGMAGFS